MDRAQYYKKFNWQKSPFIKSSSLATPIVEKLDEYNTVCECVGGWDRVMIITAPIGYGKTTFMNLLVKKNIPGVRHIISFDGYEPVENVMNKTYSTLPLWRRLFTSRVDRTDFGYFLNKHLGRDKMVLVFDEAQDYDEELFKWLRILNDRVDGLFMIFLGLSELENKITSETSFRDRKTKSIKLTPFSASELAQIVRKRIEWAGGDGIKPFTEDGIKRLSESSNTIPRLLMENGQRLIEECARKGVEVVDSIVVDDFLGRNVEFSQLEHAPFVEIKSNIGEGVGLSEHLDFLAELSPTQREIINVMMDYESISISELGEVLNKDIRSVGSLIRKLRGLNEDEVLRKPDVPYPLIVCLGKERRGGRQQYVYSLSDNVRRLMAKK